MGCLEIRDVHRQGVIFEQQVGVILDGFVILHDIRAANAILRKDFISDSGS